MFLHRVNKTLVFVITLKVSSSESKVVYSKIRKFYIIFLSENAGYKEYESSLVHTHNTHSYMHTHTTRIYKFMY